MAKPSILGDGDERGLTFPYQYKPFNGFAFFYARQPRRLCVRHADRRIQVSISFAPSAVKLRLREMNERGGAESREGRGNHISVIPSGQPYSAQWLRHADLVNIYLEPSFVVRAAGDSVRGRVVNIPGAYFVRDRFVEMLGASLREEFQVGTPNLLYAESIATVLAVHLVRNYTGTGATSRALNATLSPYWLRKALDYVEDHLGSPLTLTELAAELRMSPHYFSELFRNTTGFSPHRYVTHRRIERAKQMLTDRRLKLGEIAAALGFATHSRFTEVFTRSVGTTPREFRNCL
jgi:AraC family transcriptional regulator